MTNTLKLYFCNNVQQIIPLTNSLVECLIPNPLSPMHTYSPASAGSMSCMVKSESSMVHLCLKFLVNSPLANTWCSSDSLSLFNSQVTEEFGTWHLIVALSPTLTNCSLCSIFLPANTNAPEVYFRSKQRHHPSSHLATIDMGQKLGGGRCAFFWR